MLENNGWWGITTSYYPRATNNLSRIQIVPSAAMDNKLKKAVGQQRLQFGEGGPILQESSPESTLGNRSHRDGWDNTLLYLIQHAPKQDPGLRNSPELAPAPQHPTVQEPQPNVPDYIRNMDPIPIPDIVVIGHPNEAGLPGGRAIKAWHKP